METLTRRPVVAVEFATLTKKDGKPHYQVLSPERVTAILAEVWSEEAA